MHGHAGLAVSDNRNLDGKTADQIVDEIMANLVPGAITIPAAVFEIVRLQEKGYKLIVNH